MDLFCGIGAFSHVLESRGAKCVFACDIDPRARQIYRENHGMRPATDIRKVLAEKIPPHKMLCAGMPCRKFSTSGKRQGMQDAEGQLVFEALRIAEYHRPEVILLENVTGLLTSNDGKDFKRIVNALNKIGYDAFWDTLNAGDFGLPQFRERVFIVALRRDLGVSSFQFPTPYEHFAVIDDIVEDGADIEEFRCKRDDITFHAGLDLNAIPRAPKRIRIAHVSEGKGTGTGIHSSRGWSPCLTTGCKARIHIDGIVRFLTPRECARAMGFPDSFVLHPTKTTAHHQLANSIAVPVLDEIITAIAEQVPEVRAMAENAA